VGYRERPHPAPHLACLWVRDAEPERRRHRVLPDACVDVVWTGERLVVAGPATGPVLSDLPAEALAFGVRFGAGAAAAGLGLPASALLDLTVPAEDVWGAAGDRLAQRVAADGLPALAAAFAGDGGVDSAVRAALAGRPHGLGERHLRRRFATAVGYGPGTLRRVLRFQRFLALARAGPRQGGLARLALDAGYADQAHLTRECGRLAGLPPAALLATAAGPAGDASVPFKTPAR
jgi:AraC-like DNA-binding protein